MSKQERSDWSEHFATIPDAIAAIARGIGHR